MLQLDRRHDRRLDEAAVRERFGVGPRSIPDYLALVGDSADGFPGLPGWGAKSTAAVLARYEHLAAIPDDAREWAVDVRGAAKLAATLAGAREAAELFLDLATLRTDADVGTVDDWQWRGPTAGARRVGAAARGREPRSCAPNGSQHGANRLMETLELTVGPFRYSARADGPPDGDLVLLLHGFPETSYEWRAPLAALGRAGYRAVAPDQRGYAPGARPHDLADYHVDHLVRDVLGFADALGAERFHLVGHDWGGFVAWYVGGRHGDRLRSLCVVSTPHPTPFRGAMRGASGSDQRERSSYMQWFRTPDAEAVFLADDAALLDAIYAEHPPEAVAEYRRVFTADGGAALTGGLNWYRANDFRAPDRPDHGAHACTCGRRPTWRWGGRQPKAPRPRSPARTGSRCCPTSATGSPRSRPASSTRCSWSTSRPAE